MSEPKELALAHNTNSTVAALEAGRALATDIRAHPAGPRYKHWAVIRDAGGDALVALDPEEWVNVVPPHGKQGTWVMHDLDSFLRYWGEHALAESRVYARMDPAVKFVAVLDEYDPHGDAAWRGFRIEYTPAHSKEWLEWTKQDRQRFQGNEAFALWLEDHLPDVVSPPADELLRIINTFRIDEGRVWKGEQNLANGQVDLAYSRHVDGHAADSKGGRVTIPEGFEISVPVFAGLEAEAYTVQARFRYRLKDAQLSLWYELVRPHKTVELAFRDMVAKIRTATEDRVYFGVPPG